jgi:hypothetical protein
MFHKNCSSQCNKSGLLLIQFLLSSCSLLSQRNVAWFETHSLQHAPEKIIRSWKIQRPSVHIWLNCRFSGSKEMSHKSSLLFFPNLCCQCHSWIRSYILYSMAWVCERPPLVGKVNASFWG